jgi:hypothetical protein
MSERANQEIWAEARALHDRTGDQSRPWLATAIKREENSATAVALSDGERNILYDAIASERAGKETV